MRKALFIVMNVVLFAGFCVLASAYAEQMKGSMTGTGMTEGDMMGDEGMTGSQAMMMPQGKMMGMCSMHGMMMKTMFGKHIVATQDGGIVVMAGNKLIKFDKDLNRIKEVEIMDAEGIKKTMMQMEEECPMHKMMMQGGSAEEEKPAGAVGPEEASGHESHH